jgi:hypothetical protein
MRTERIEEVDALVSLYASPRLLKKTPNEELIPIIMKLLAMMDATMIQP